MDCYLWSEGWVFTGGVLGSGGAGWLNTDGTPSCSLNVSCTAVWNNVAR